ISSVPTCLDGYPLAKKGKGGPALGISAIASFGAGIMGVIGLVCFAPVLADQALKFGPPEYFALMILALTLMVSLSGTSLVKALLMGGFGYTLALIGLGPSSGMPRFDYGSSKLAGGLDMISIIIGLFAIAEVLKGIEEKRLTTVIGKTGRVYPSKADLKKSFAPMLRGGIIGFFLGLLPGCSAAISSFLAYDMEKKSSKEPEQFGRGAIEGVAAPEAANNATSSAGFIPLFSLGIPSSPPLAILLAGLMIYGLTPGPVLFEQNGPFVWTVIASMFIGNAMLLFLNLPMVWLWVKLTKVPYGIMAPIILMLCTIGAFSVRNSLFDVLVAYVFGGLGYLFHRYQWPIVPLILCFILGPLLEESFIQTMAMSSGHLMILLERPISFTILVIAAIFLTISMGLNRRTQKRVKEEKQRGIDVA
ncbi:MAG TPA: tripartite tricarboxylate transporter permease, partial [Candidatus Bathyarchaeia archaeon]|nr:tripartite tricarboxylate transporter permease [Candidatus Bathyarchaeia archaeon]